MTRSGMSDDLQAAREAFESEYAPEVACDGTPDEHGLECACVTAWWLFRVAKIIALAQKAAMEKACAAMCGGCARGFAVEPRGDDDDGFGVMYWHDERYCDANPIRELIAKEAP